ncbi:MAG TPA: IS30 family transposase [Thermoguttaceae bacterium]|nr:IS30 family transposase [Thermoguttaceae bacterium]
MASHLTVEEREVIAHMHRAGRMQTQIAERLGRSKSTISRELQRNRSRNGYWAVAAQRKAERRRSERPWIAKMQRPEVRRYVQDRLRKRWSPDQIAGRSHADFPHDRQRQISHQTIYTWIGSERVRGKLWQRYLRRLGRKRPDPQNRGRLPGGVSIEGRPAVVDRRGRYGDWEGDTIVGANRRGGAVTLVERKSGYLLLGKVPDLKAATVRKAAAGRYATTPAALRKTLTLDNGKEFAEHEQLEVEAALKIYFAKPYCAWQRGTNENTNGLIRQFFPKGTDLANIPEHRFTKVQQLLNDRPRKRLGYRSPNEVLASRLKVAIET